MKKIILGTLLFTLAIGVNSCRKEKDTNAIVTVLNSADLPVANAEVHLYCPATTCTSGILSESMDVIGTTGLDGKVTFNFTEQYKLGQAGFAVLDVEITSGTNTASGVIKIEEEVDNEQTIICQTCP